MSAGSTRRTSRATARTTRGGGGKGGSAGGAIAAILVVGLILGGFAVFQHFKNQAELAAANKTMGFVVAAVDLPVGHTISSRDITIMRTKSKIPNGFTNLGDPALLGKSLNIAVSANSYILRNMLSYEGASFKPQNTALKPKAGESSVVLVLSGSEAIQPFIQKGKAISVFRSRQTNSGNKIITSLSKRARILHVKRSEENTLANVRNNSERLTYVTLGLPTDEAQKLSMFKAEAVIVDGHDREPPSSSIVLFQQWMGIEKEEVELTSEVGSSLIQKPVSEEGGN